MLCGLWNSPAKSPAPTATDPNAAIPSCPFCHASKETGFNVLYEDAQFVVFRDIRPSAAHHLQLVPRRHVSSVRSLGRADLPMLQAMAALSAQILEGLEVPPERRRLGFHIPPFNSVDHLHMHVQALPYTPALLRLKYPVAPGRNGRHKGLSWFVTAEQAIAILDAGAPIRVLPC